MDIQEENLGIKGLRLKTNLQKIDFTLDNGLAAIKKIDRDDLEDVKSMLNAMALFEVMEFEELKRGNNEKLKKIKSLESGVGRKRQEIIVRTSRVTKQKSLR